MAGNYGKVTDEDIETRAQELWGGKREQLGLRPAPLPKERMDFRLYALGQLLAEEAGFTATALPPGLNVRSKMD